MIEKLDKSVPSVLIEVLVAEVTLSDEEKTGFEFLAQRRLSAAAGSPPERSNTLGVSVQGLSFTLDSAGETRAMLNFFYKDDRVVIRSRPRLLVKSGETASIDVGNEIPVITQTSADETQVGGSTNVLQDVTYRKTGVQLEIKPLVQANGLVDLQISQQLSEARPTAATSLTGSPTILNRQISTSLTLKDGGSLLMGGLISGNQSAGVTGVPFLGQVPVLGRLFALGRRAGGPHRAAGDGHPLRGRGPRGGLGAHPAGARAARPAQRTLALTRSGPSRISTSGTGYPKTRPAMATTKARMKATIRSSRSRRHREPQNHQRLGEAHPGTAARALRVVASLRGSGPFESVCRPAGRDRGARWRGSWILPRGVAISLQSWIIPSWTDGCAEPPARLHEIEIGQEESATSTG